MDIHFIMVVSIQRRIRLGVLALVLSVAGFVILAQQTTAIGQGDAGVYAEAIQHANIRSGPGVDYATLGEILAGTKYPIVGRSAHYPWYLITLPTNIQGWVFKDIVKVTGDINSVPISEAILNTAIPSLSPTMTVAAISTSFANPQSSPQIPPTAVHSPAPATARQPVPESSVYAEAIDSSNVRYGPGLNFPPIARINKGELYPVLRTHSLYPWIEISLGQGVSRKRGWVFKANVTVTGNLNNLPSTGATDFGYPTLTPTQPMVVTSLPPWTVTPNASTKGKLSSLSNDIYNYLLNQQFVPGTDKQGSAFLMDLSTGEHFSLNPGIAYSGMSLIKIPILVSLYRKLTGVPTREQASLIGGMMVCSENSASNGVLRFLGDGDVYKGSAYVTETMQMLGLKNTFLVGPLAEGKVDPNAPKPTTAPVSTIKTNADQFSTDPDLFNQSTPDDLGWLLTGVYQCAIDGSGPLNATFPGTYNETKCRQMIRAMRADDIPALIRAGVPENIPVAHKHGWVDETHGDAAQVTTPGGDYVLVIELHNKHWLNYDESFPVIAEISRVVYNTYNPTAKLAQTNTKSVPFCSLDTIDPKLFTDLQASSLPPIR